MPIEWHRLASIAAVRYGQPMREAWSMTYRELAGMMEIDGTFSRTMTPDDVADLQQSLADRGFRV